MRWSACELHRCKRCGGKQHETKFCHDDPSPPGRFSAAKSHSQSQTVMSRSTACMGPHCGARKKGNVFYFARTRGWARNLFIAHSEATLVRETLRSEPALTGSEPAQCISAQCFCLTHFLQANWHLILDQVRDRRWFENVLIRRRIWRGRAWRSRCRDFVRYLSGQFIGRRWRARLAHRRRHFRTWIAGRILLRRLGRLEPQRGPIREKLTMTGSNPSRNLGRTELSSDRHGSADVVSFRSSV